MLLLLVSGRAYLKPVEKDPKIDIQSASSYTTLDIMKKES